MKLRPYQESAVDWCITHPRNGLFLDMGMGKTAITLTALQVFGLPRTLVVAPKRVADVVWPVEAAKWSKARVVSVRGTPAQRVAALREPGDIYVIGRDNLAWLTRDGLTNAYGRRKRQHKFDAVILDELSSYRQHDSARTKAAKRLCVDADPDIVIGLTGTPVGNSLMSLWSEMLLIDKGATFGTSLSRWRAKYFQNENPYAPFPTWAPKPDTQTRLFEAIKPWTLSMSSDLLEGLMPDMLPLNRIEVPFGPKELSGPKSYDSFLRNAVYGVLGWQKDANGTRVPILADYAIPTLSAAALRNKLLQYTSGFIYGPNGLEFVNDNKLNALAEIAESLDGDPVMVMYRFTEERDRIMARFPQAETIDAPDAVTRWNAGKIPVLVAHPASAGHGLNLQHGGSHQVWTTAPDSQELWSQGVKRLHRPGQTRPVKVSVLETPGTFDADALDSVLGKVRVEEALRDYLESQRELKGV